MHRAAEINLAVVGRNNYRLVKAVASLFDRFLPLQTPGREKCRRRPLELSSGSKVASSERPARASASRKRPSAIQHFESFRRDAGRLCAGRFRLRSFCPRPEAPFAESWPVSNEASSAVGINPLAVEVDGTGVSVAGVGAVVDGRNKVGPSANNARRRALIVFEYSARSAATLLETSCSFRGPG